MDDPIAGVWYQFHDESGPIMLCPPESEWIDQKPWPPTIHFVKEDGTRQAVSLDEFQRGLRYRVWSGVIPFGSPPTPKEFDPMTPTPRPLGRPPKPANERRTERLSIRWSPDELELLEYRAAKSGVPVAVFVRLSSLGRND
mgnify:CR=1 FL=1|jgi:hypothetical protein